MGILSGLRPEKVFYYFEEISKIPHGSGNVERISDYLVNFARKRNLSVIQDELKNVIIVQEATPGYEDEPTVILQGHMDMVAVKKPDYDINMKTEGLRISVRGDDIYAEGTSLGGDDGIAVAYALALLDSEELQHPRLEIVITVDEEVGMDGARGIDLSTLRGSRLLNLDSEEEGIFLTSCAGGACVSCKLSMGRQPARGIVCELFIGGLLGGHSGEEIHKERGNSNSLFGRALWLLSGDCHVQLIHVEGGLADNAIPRETAARLLFPTDSAGCVKLLEQMEREVAVELGVKDPGFRMEWRFGDEAENVMALSVGDTRRVAAMLHALPNGVQAMSADMPGLVETSLNMGILRMKAGDNVETAGEADNAADAETAGDTDNKMNTEAARDAVTLRAEFAVRSSVESAKVDLIERLKAITELAGGEAEVKGMYPGWKYRADSPLRDKMIRVYKRMYGTEPEVQAIHAGLECGLLAGKIKDLDCVSIGPDMKNIHTTEETLSISSTKRVWEYLVAFLAEKD